MWAIARQNPATTEDLSQLNGLGEWRRLTYGEDIIKALRRR
jgi:hypothetical protein